MNFQEYQDLTGLTIPASREAAIYAQIRRTQAMLETMIGYTLDQDLTDENQYTEVGKTTVECPCAWLNCGGVDVGTLTPPDPVVYAYRMYTYNPRDKFLAIDPATAINSVKLVNNGVTFRTMDPDEYRLDFKRGLVKYLEQCNKWCLCKNNCTCVQLAVDADWVWPDTATIPMDLQVVWADMVTYYSDPKRDVKLEVLATHKYEKFDRLKPEELPANLAIIQRYVGPNGSMYRNPAAPAIRTENYSFGPMIGQSW